MSMQIWVRAESKANEHRTPLVPKDCQRLMAAGFEIFVEKSADRCMADEAYEAVGCGLMENNTWADAPSGAWILGIKELPHARTPLHHNHIYFGHAFKGQSGWQTLLNRFVDGGGCLYDLECLTDETGRRLAAFGYWAGFAGAALGIQAWLGRQAGNSPGLSRVQVPTSKDDLIAKLAKGVRELGRSPTLLVTGALGRCGTGARDLAIALECKVTGWDMPETAFGGPFPEILAHDIFVNCVLASPKTPVFVEPSALAIEERRLSVIADVSCDPSSDYNPVAIYDRTTTFDRPTWIVGPKHNPIEICAIDHLPSLMPIEASEDYSKQLMPVLLELADDRNSIWARARSEFKNAVSRL